MYFFNIKPYTDQYFTYYYMMSANWVSVKIMVPSECRPTGFLPTARPPIFCGFIIYISFNLLLPSLLQVPVSPPPHRTPTPLEDISEKDEIGEETHSDSSSYYGS